MKDLLVQKVSSNEEFLKKIYGKEYAVCKERINRIIGLFHDNFSGDAQVYSASGRVEIIGNHTDHNNGCVLAASVGFDTVAVAAPNGTDYINLISEGYDEMFKINIKELLPLEEEKNTTNAIIRGVVGYFSQNGLNAGGFDAYVTSVVPGGSGLSSSAAFEILVGYIMSDMFNSAALAPETLAIAGQYAENVYFGKPCGLMDQMASAYGGIVGIDFKDPKNPVAQPIDVDFSKSGYIPVIVKVGDSHADLTHEYTAITGEMKEISVALGVDRLRNVSEEEFYNQLPNLFGKVNDRAILRAMHYFDENNRVAKAIECLKNNDIDGFLKCVNESGNSSWKYLQNCYAGSEQMTTVALALAHKLLNGRGASRVHGGGFGGTILAFVPEEQVPEFTAGMDRLLGEGSSSVLYIRPVGACKIV